MTVHPTSAGVDDKAAPLAEHHDVVDSKHDTTAQGQEVSGYETLGLWETVMKFKMTTFICFMMCFSAATDGYQVK
jgi:hypothetical protein